MSKQKVTVSEIPNTSVLSPYQRKGREGICGACGEKLHTHFGHKGAWRGCKAEGVQDGVLFVLMPIAPTVGQLKRVKASVTTPVSAVPTPSTPRISYVYRAKDKRVRPKDLSKGWQKVYRALRKATEPLDVVAIARMARRPVEATRVTLNRMALHVVGLAVRVAVEPKGETIH